MSDRSGAASAWKVYDDGFRALMGASPSLDLLLEFTDYPFAHEACVFIEATNELFVTSNRFPDPVTKQPTIRISKISLGDGSQPPKREEIHSDKVLMGNGGVNYKGGVLFCAQGNMTEPSGLFLMDVAAPYPAQAVVTTFLSRPFNSVNDVVVHSDGSIWFTDPIYGYEQGFRPKPRLPCQVYRYDPAKDAIRAVADGFGRPNGICFSPDQKIVYVTDTDWIHGDGTTDDERPSSIYAFDLVYYSGEPFLANRRLFAMADYGIPDGIKCDLAGNVYSGCDDGVNVWSPGGVLLGKILVDGGVANFCFGRNGELFILNETRLWRAQLGPGVKGALLGI